MRDFLLKKYSMFDCVRGSKVFTQEMLMDELLCTRNLVQFHQRQTIKTAKELMTFDEFLKVVEISLDLE